ncbi:MAG TPA: DUF262 domain-containing HNH endonuclease family protein [Planctomycetaceae bacterium]|jgi:hypothetical protein|nr:DUF262 domain-containing HNH endonuclease family protein [Planctomycetaceae bacterium]
MSGIGKIGIADLGIGQVIKHNKLTVPLNQREYSWTEKEVVDLFDDLQKSIDRSEPNYFLGTIALTGTDPGEPEVTDGQQRLATTTILLSAMRDYFVAQDDVFNAEVIERNYLTIEDQEARKWVPRLTMNIDDREFFGNQIATRPGDAKRKKRPKGASNERIESAISLAKDRIAKITGTYSKVADQTKRLTHWMKFVTNQALVIALTLPSDLDAFRMFETLNDRGLKTSQVDIIKNYLFREAARKMSVVQPVWSRMIGILDSLDIEEVALVYLRHFLITLHGASRERELYEKVEGSVSGATAAVEFIGKLDESAVDYAAILSPDHRKWNTYPRSIINSIRTLRELRVVQIRPLMLAVATRFEPREAERAFKAFVSWTVRFLIAGGGRGGTLDEHYGRVAREVGTGKATTTMQLERLLIEIIPNDAAFEESFSGAKVSKNYLARYYLRALELKLKGDKEPEWIPNEDAAINLEHIIPENPGNNWPHVSRDQAEALLTRLGNMALLQASKNSVEGNASFPQKAKSFKQSAYILTSEIAKENGWDGSHIDKRQKRLAKLAVQTWPIRH